MADADAIYELAQRIESSIEVDKRVAALHSLQSQLESAGYVVEADAVTSAVKVALKHANQALSTASLAFIPTYASMIYSGDGTESHSVLNHNVRMLVNSVGLLVIDKLGDQKERIREAARTAIIELANAAYAISSGHITTSGKGKETETPLGIFERSLREAGLAAKFARVREQSVLLLPILRQNCEKYPVRPLVPITVELLSDADATVREGARSTLIALFSNAAPAAKADLKKELEKRAVRKQTADAILREVLAAPSSVAPSVLSPEPAPARSHASSYTDAEVPARQHKTTAPSTHAAPPPPTASAAATATADDIRPVYIASRSDLERTFASMLPFFEGKESEHNWLNREQSMIKIRGLVVSGAHRQFGESFFLSQLKVAQEGVLKCVASLRTTLSMHAIHLVQELAIELGDDLAPCVEPFLTSLTAMAGFTKKLIANATQEAAAAIMVNVSFRPLYLQLIWHGIQDKNVATRTAAAEHLATVLSHHAAHRKHAVESHGGLDLLDKCFRKGVGDSNPAARTRSREAFWIFHQYWPDQATTILQSLDPSTKKQVAATAPPDVEAEVVQEQKPKSAPGPVRARPGGASMALIQAKKAAALKAAQERERQKAEEAAAAHEARVAAARAALAGQQQQEMLQQQQQDEPQYEAYVDEAATPVAPQRKATGFMPTRHRSQQAGQAGQSTQLKATKDLSVLLSPTAHQRIQTAIAVPLPTSPTPVAANGSAPNRYNGHASQSETSSQPRSPGLSPTVSRTRAISSSSFSSQGSGSASGSSARHHASTSTPRATHTAQLPTSDALDSDLADLSVADVGEDDETIDATQHARTSDLDAGGEDETLQLAAPEDASMDLMGMNFASPFKVGSGRAAKTRSVLVGRGAGDAGDSFEQTPQAVRTRAQPTKTPTRTVSSGSSNSTGSGTPASAVRRSGLPRPVSMIHSPASAGLQPMPRSTSQSGLATASRAPTSGGMAAGTVLENRAKRLEAGMASPAKARPEVWTWIETLKSGTADLRTFRRLAKLSADFRVAARSAGDGGDEAEEGDETVLTAGPIANASNRVTPSDEDGRSSGKPASGSDAFASDTAAWEEGGLFVALLEGVQRYVPTQASETRTNADVELSALAVLNRLVENQYPVLCSTATERSLLDTLLGALDSLCGASISRSSAVVAHKTILTAWESVLSTWALRCDAVLGFDLLLPHALDAAIVPVLRSGYTPLLLRLPSQLVLEDFLPRLRGVIVQALRGDKAEHRLAATTMLKKLNDAARPYVAESHTRIFSALQLSDADRALLDVLMYYFSKP
ncbi:uncharacterized protein PAN0_013c4753 [Moesziomyces antarcticus]|uniref:Uncharacterized protein n=2 Tax=Pseudozyma antarctica TaxID=84753 RepID=A0A081CIN5_PSEA2|nr:uncharacterized protein PAN0_013c4753 [Moesziomyces antarcticus]GAK66531.1 conserved hypothetical protein [Moesziomyces antarcticus]SPO47577.1 related to STU1 - component of the mitotic spindle [Moesziomyces antarcticus]